MIKDILSDKLSRGNLDYRVMEDAHMDDLAPGPDDTGTPLWVKVFGIIFIVLVLMFVILHITGGPRSHGSHMPGGDAPPGQHRVQQP